MVQEAEKYKAEDEAERKKVPYITSGYLINACMFLSALAPNVDWPHQLAIVLISGLL